MYAVIKYFCLDVTLSTNIIMWSATLFPSIVIMYTFQNWRNQKASEIVANEAKIIADKLNEHLAAHRAIIMTNIHGEFYHQKIDEISQDYLYLKGKLYFLADLVNEIYDHQNTEHFKKVRDDYLRQFMSYTTSHYTNYEFKKDPSVNDKNLTFDFGTINENYASVHLRLYNTLIKILMHSEDLKEDTKS